MMKTEPKILDEMREEMGRLVSRVDSDTFNLVNWMMAEIYRLNGLNPRAEFTPVTTLDKIIQGGA